MATITSSIGTAARAYSTIQAWEDAIPATPTDHYVGECYNDSEFVTISPVVLFSGTTTSGSATITLKCAAGQSFYDHAGKLTNQRKYDASKGVALRSTSGGGGPAHIVISEDYVTIDGLQIDGANFKALSSSSTNTIVKNSIAQSGNPNSGDGVINVGGGSVTNCVAINSGGGSVVVDLGNATFHNVTAVQLGAATNYGFRGNYTAPLYTNCASFGAGTAFRAGTSGSSDYNVSDDASAPGGHSLVNKTFASQFVNITNTSAMDFRVKAGADLINAGVRDATYTADLDIIKQARSTTTPTIGAEEYVSAAGIALSSNANARTIASGTLSTSIPLGSAATSKTVTSSALSTNVVISATAAAPVAASSALSTGVAIAAASSALTRASGILSTAIPLGANAVTSTAASSALTTGNVWAANAVSASSAGSTLTTAIPVGANAVAPTSASSTLTTGNVWAANAVAAASASSALTTAVAIGANANASTAASSALTVGNVWAASAISTARASAALTSAIAVGAIARAATSASSTLTAGIAAAIAANASAQCRAGATLSIGTPPLFGPLSITRTMMINLLRSLLVELANPLRVIRAPVNRAAMPVGPFVLLTPGATIPLATPTVTVDSSGHRTVKRSSQFNCQIDCYGPDSGDLAELITIFWREQYAVEKFAASGLEIAPLYASDAKQMPIVTGEEQYLERWTFELAMQFNPMVSTVQQSANMLNVGIISVDEAYPPQP